MTKCRVRGCKHEAYLRGVCKRCYFRWRDYRDMEIDAVLLPKMSGKVRGELTRRRNMLRGCEDAGDVSDKRDYLATNRSVPGRVRCLQCGETFRSPDKVRIRRCARCHSLTDAEHTVRAGRYTVGHSVRGF